MWVMTTQGFYSAVEHREDPEKLLIRARARIDLVRLDRQVPGVRRRIVKTKDADYLYRVTVSREEWALALARLSAEVDYDNFKNAVKVAQGHKRASVYGRVWSALTEIEKGFERRYYGRFDRVPRSRSSRQLFFTDAQNGPPEPEEDLRDRMIAGFGPDPVDWPAWECGACGQRDVGWNTDQCARCGAPREESFHPDLKEPF